MNNPNTNGHRPTPPPPAEWPTSKRAAPPTVIPVSTRAALILLWLSTIDRDDAARDRALAMLPDDPEVRAIAATLCEIGAAIEPRLRCHAAREHALDMLATVDTVFRITTGRI